MKRRTSIAAALLTAATRGEAKAYGLRERRVHVSDADLAVVEGGRAGAPTVVLLHGYSADRLVWVRFARHLVKDFRVVIPELAGHGGSGFTPGIGYSAPDQARRVVELMDRLGIDRAHIGGNSMGGFIAATLGADHGERVRSLLLCDAAGVESPEPSDAEVIFRDGGNPFLLDSVDDFDAFYAMTMARPPFVPASLRAAMAADYVRRRDQLDEIFTDFFGVAMLDQRLSEITAPTLVMWGEKDRLIHTSAAPVWAEGIAGSTLVTYADLGHMPMLEAPARSAADYRAFLAGLTREG